MRPRLSRVRRPEWGIGIESAALLVIVFGAPWYRVLLVSSLAEPTPHGSPYRTGWQSLSVLGPLALVVGVLGLGVWWLQATRRSPALPAVATVCLLVLSFALTVGLLIRVLIAHPEHTTSVRYGAYAGLVLALSVFAGSFRSMRLDGIADEDGPPEIETVDLEGQPAAGGR